MPTAPQALVIRTAGTNCDAEMCRAFEQAGAGVSLLHVDRLATDPSQVDEFDLIGFPGGFSYGDDIASGRILAMRLRERLYPALRNAASRGCPMIGACNGFQVMVQLGLLPGPSAGHEWPENRPPLQTAALSHNSSGRFIDRWVRVSANAGSSCVWTRPLVEMETSLGHREDILLLPVAHGEGRFTVADSRVLEALQSSGQVALKYVDNVNGSEGSIAGVCDPSGRIFGLMPHPERYLDWTLHPYWTRLSAQVRRGPTPGAMMFRAAVDAAVAVG